MRQGGSEAGWKGGSKTREHRVRDVKEGRKNEGRGKGGNEERKRGKEEMTWMKRTKRGRKG